MCLSGLTSACKKKFEVELNIHLEVRNIPFLLDRTENSIPFSTQFLWSRKTFFFKGDVFSSFSRFVAHIPYFGVRLLSLTLGNLQPVPAMFLIASDASIKEVAYGYIAPFPDARYQVNTVAHNHGGIITFSPVVSEASTPPTPPLAWSTELPLPTSKHESGQELVITN